MVVGRVALGQSALQESNNAVQQRTITTALPQDGVLASRCERPCRHCRRRNEHRHPAVVGPGGGFTARASMDILAGMLAYVAGIGALFAGLAVAFFVFVATPKAPLQAQSEPQSAHAL